MPQHRSSRRKRIILTELQRLRRAESQKTPRETFPRAPILQRDPGLTPEFAAHRPRAARIFDVPPPRHSAQALFYNACAQRQWEANAQNGAKYRAHIPLANLRCRIATRLRARAPMARTAVSN
jgi:hypothetical protein